MFSGVGGNQARTYRQQVRSHLNVERVTVQETDLSIHSRTSVAEIARNTVITQRAQLEAYIRRHPGFLRTLNPWPYDPLAPRIVHAMIDAGQTANVGPMAAVAGAFAEQVGAELLKSTPEIIVENGGDIFLGVQRALTVGVYAGASPLSMKIGLRIDPAHGIRAVCTSSATVGHSLSLGRADAVCVLSASCALADAMATALGNRVRRSDDIPIAIDWGRGVQGVHGVLIILGDKMGAWGQLETIAL